MIPPFRPGASTAKLPFAEAALRRVAPARRAALAVLQAADEGGYASDLLRSLTVELDSRDAGLANQIVFGTLRLRLQLDFLIQHYSGRPADGLHPAVRNILRSAIFQLRYLERIPPHAAVHDAVELTKAYRRAAAGLVNAVLRKVNRVAIEWPDRATELSCPPFLLTRWDQHFGPAAATTIARAALQPPIPYVRLPEGEPAPPEVKLASTPVPGAWRVLDDQPPGLRLHDIGSQTVLPHLDLYPGATYLDLCAAPGNKTRQAIESGLRLAVACDVSESRLQTVGPICPRIVLDATEPLPFQPASFDRIFIDAPCSGTGTIGRNPEIKWRVQLSDLPEYARRQVRLVKQAAPLLAPGGKLLYATCSLEREENEAVVATAAAESGLTVVNQWWRLPGTEPGDGFYSALMARKS